MLLRPPVFVFSEVAHLVVTLFLLFFYIFFFILIQQKQTRIVSLLTQ